MYRMSEMPKTTKLVGGKDNSIKRKCNYHSCFVISLMTQRKKYGWDNKAYGAATTAEDVGEGDLLRD